jgi:hypothetical protein
MSNDPPDGTLTLIQLPLLRPPKDRRTVMTELSKEI